MEAVAYTMPATSSVAMQAMPATTYTVQPAAYTMQAGSSVQMMPAAMPAYTMQPGSSVQVMPAAYTAQPQYLPQYSLPSAPSMVSYQYPMAEAAPAVDYSQGKWFAPGEPLPAGYIPVAHPEGALEPQQGHAMSDMASSSFVLTSGIAPAETKPEEKPLQKSLGKKKSSKKKKTSGCC
eukprot:gb/GFBE01020431.1/.p1 GENE.gb/GFBE01020431.1/~~gb/GFBE01020431.1/.p1  ORF type:complete len:178 (+),score=52.58 gb/GFBE01020431.1/:1-534(+)